MTLSQSISCVCLLVCIMSCSHAVQALKRHDVVRVEGVDLRSVYRRLEKAGFAPGPYHPEDLGQLSQAITRFQAFAHLEQNGQLGPKTWEKLRWLYDPEAPQSSETASADALSLPPSILVALQKVLTELGYETAGTSGRFDPSTRQALRRFQRAQKLPGDGALTPQTLGALFERYCHHGCQLNFAAATQGQDNTAAGRPRLLNLTASDWYALYIKAIQTLLAGQGYDTGDIDGVIGPSIQEALRQFQVGQGLPSHGQLTEDTVRALFRTGCRMGCRLSLSLQPPAPETTPAVVTVPQGQMTHIPAGRFSLDYPVELHDAVYALEKIECSDVSGAWVIFFQGTVLEKDDSSVLMRLAERFGYRYAPKREGVDRTDWWCVPKRRHCYSTIAFNDWGGTFTRGQEKRFAADEVYSARMGIVTGMSQVLRQYCDM